MIKAAFIDRDGVINIDRGYVYKIEDFEWVPGAIDALKKLTDLGYVIFIVTNQSGIGRGYYSETDFLKLTSWIENNLKKAGVNIAKTYFCPHHPSKAKAEYLLDCNCRKPNPGMLLAAQKEFNINMKESVIFGDKPSDIEAGFSAGVFRRVIVGKNGSETPLESEKATDKFASLIDAVSKF